MSEYERRRKRAREAMVARGEGEAGGDAGQAEGGNQRRRGGGRSGEAGKEGKGGKEAKEADGDADYVPKPSKRTRR